MNIRAERKCVETIQVSVNGVLHSLTDDQADVLIQQLSNARGAMSTVSTAAFATRVKLVIANAFEISIGRLESPERTDQLAVARWIAFKLLRERGMTFSAIGQQFGRDHGTVQYGLNELQERIKLREPMAAEIELLRQRVNA